jgi:uncharacterized membrane protein YfcA
MALSLAQGGLGLASGGLVGFSLGLAGGGGSILAVPLLVYLVGIASPHVAIGTSAVAVAANALVNLVGHARAGSVKWRCATVFALSGVSGAAIGSRLGQMIDGQRLLALFAVLMLVVGGLMLKGRGAAGEPSVRLDRENLPKLVVIGFASGALSGFFGIGGGFLIVPGLVLATGMPTFNAVGSSLVAVAAFALTTSVTYAAAGLVDWPLAALFIVGGAGGGLVGTGAARALAARKGMLNTVFAGIIVVVALYVLARSVA